MIKGNMGCWTPHYDAPPMPHVKPPLGLTPRYVHDEWRFKDIKAAIIRRAEGDASIKTEWIEEYNELLEKRKERYGEKD